MSIIYPKLCSSSWVKSFRKIIRQDLHSQMILIYVLECLHIVNDSTPNHRTRIHEALDTCYAKRLHQYWKHHILLLANLQRANFDHYFFSLILETHKSHFLKVLVMVSEKFLSLLKTQSLSKQPQNQYQMIKDQNFVRQLTCNSLFLLFWWWSFLV